MNKFKMLPTIGWITWSAVARAQDPSSEGNEEPQAAPAANSLAKGTLAAGVTATQEPNPLIAAQSEAEGSEDPRQQRPTGSYAGPVSNDEDSWKFDYFGYFRAPLRVGVAKRDVVYPGQSKDTYHAPLVPDDQYLSWQSTKHNRRDWAELFLGYGNGWAKGIVGLQAFNFTDASFSQNGTQFGISQGWLELAPELPWDNLRFKAKIGSFWNRYGSMGQWDAGEYDTYLFGRTHAMGEVLRLEMDIPDQPLTIGIEHGVGAKKPDSQIYNAARFTLLNHAHADLSWEGRVRLGLHFLHSFAAEEPRFTGPQPAWVYPNEQLTAYMGPEQPDGRMMVFGGEARFDMPDVFGFLYLGASYVSLKDAVTVAPAIEVIHSYGGGEFNMGVTSNYLDSEACRWNLTGAICSRGNGGVMTLAGQYVAKFNDLAGTSLFGENQDLTVKLYGMYNQVKSDDPMNDGMAKLKAGTDVSFDTFDFLALATRFDYLSPNSRAKKQDFMVLSPRVVFRTNLVTHEQVSLQYSRYFYSQRECDVGTPSDIQGSRSGAAAPGITDWVFGASLAERDCAQPPPSSVTPDGWGASTENQEPRLRGMPITGTHLRPDVNVISLEASMWW